MSNDDDHDVLRDLRPGHPPACHDVGTRSAGCDEAGEHCNIKLY